MHCLAKTSKPPHAFEHLLDVSDRRVGQDAVAEVEDERRPGERFENRIDAVVERGTAGAQRQRIEIALHRTPALDLIARETQINHPIQTDSIDFNVLDVAFQIAAGTARKPDDLRARHRAPHIGNDSLRRRNAPAHEFAGRQNSCPSIEDLHSLDTGAQLTISAGDADIIEIGGTGDF